MLRYADAIVKRGVDKLIDAIGHSPEPQTKNAETPQQQKRMGNDTDCAPQTTGSTTNRGLTAQTIPLMDELCDMRYNVPDCMPEVQRRDQPDKGFVPVSRQGGQPCLSLCEKPRRQPYVAYAAYVLMSTALSGPRANSPYKSKTRFAFLLASPCITLHHPFLLRNSLIFNMRYIMEQKSDEVRKNNEGGCIRLMRPPS